MLNSSDGNQQNIKRTKSDIYLLLDNMAININKLFESLGINISKYEVKTPNTIMQLIQYLLTNNILIENLEALNEQIKEAVQKNEELRLEMWSNSQSADLWQDEIEKLTNRITELEAVLGKTQADYEHAKQMITDQNNQIDRMKHSYSKQVKDLEKINMNFINTLISYRDSIIIKEGLAKEDSSENSLAIQKIFALLLKETAGLMEKNGIEVLDHKGAFDSSIHIVTDTRATKEKELHDTVAEVFRPGYKYGANLIRPQEVILYSFKE